MKDLSYSPSTVHLHPRVKPVHVLPTRFALHQSQGMVFISRSDILYCKAESNYTRFYLSEGRHYIVSKTLGEVGSKLPKSIFFRIHQSHLVNLEAVTCISRQHVVMLDHKQLPVARSKRQLLLEKMQQITISI